MLKYRLILPLLFLSTSSACIAQDKFLPPPPPVSGFEFFGAAKGTHIINSFCENSSKKSSISWDFNGHSVNIKSFRFNGESVSEAKLMELNQYAQEIERGFTVWIRCGNEGVSISMDGTNKSSGDAKVGIRLNWIQATKKWKLIRKINL